MCRVLLVEDESTAREVLKRMIRHGGHEVEAAACARSAEEVAERFRPEVAVLDWLLPDENGDVLAQALRALMGQRVGVVFITGLSGHDLRRHLDELEPCTLLIKPFGQRRLLDAISSLALMGHA